MVIEKFEVGDMVWRTPGFQEMRIESIDNRSATAIVSWTDQNSHRIISPVPVSLPTQGRCQFRRHDRLGDLMPSENSLRITPGCLAWRRGRVDDGSSQCGGVDREDNYSRMLAVPPVPSNP